MNTKVGLEPRLFRNFHGYFSIGHRCLCSSTAEPRQSCRVSCLVLVGFRFLGSLPRLVFLLLGMRSHRFRGEPRWSPIPAATGRRARRPAPHRCRGCPASPRLQDDRLPGDCRGGVPCGSYSGPAHRPGQGCRGDGAVLCRGPTVDAADWVANGSRTNGLGPPATTWRRVMGNVGGLIFFAQMYEPSAAKKINPPTLSITRRHVPSPAPRDHWSESRSRPSRQRRQWCCRPARPAPSPRQPWPGR